jgi:hypothetical protein
MRVALIAPLVALPYIIYDGVQILVLDLEGSDQSILRLYVHGPRTATEVHAYGETKFRHLRLRAERAAAAQHHSAV